MSTARDARLALAELPCTCTPDLCDEEGCGYCRALDPYDPCGAEARPVEDDE